MIGFVKLLSNDFLVIDMAKAAVKEKADFDYSDFQSPDDVGDNLMARIQGLAQDHMDAEARVASLEAQVTEAKAVLRDITEKKLPDLLDEADLGESTITTPAGHQVKLGTAIRGSIPKGKEQPAFDWLDKTKNGKLIKRTFTIEFGKGDEAWANKFERDCAKRKKPLNLKRKMGVNTNTLQAFIKQQLEDGVDIPLDIFGAYRQRFAKVTLKS
jgi:hypothetical protein